MGGDQPEAIPGAGGVPDCLGAGGAGLVGDWYHSLEEDTGGCVVYRPAIFEFPRARMPRRSLHLGPDGVASIGEPGAGDRRTRRPARWSLVDDLLTIEVETMTWTLHVEVRADGTLLRSDTAQRRS